MMIKLRQSVLQSFKKLHKTRIRVFDGDTRAQTAARLKINEEFKKNKHVTDEQFIAAMIKFAEDVEKELRTQVIQAKQVRPGVFEAKLTPETAMLDNLPFNDKAIPDDGISGENPKTCCKDQGQS